MIIFTSANNIPSNLRAIERFKYLFIVLISFLFINATSIKSVDKYEITLDLKEVSLNEVFIDIEKQTNFKFFYKNSDIDEDIKITIKVRNESIDTVLKKVFEGDDVMVFKVKKDQVIIKKIPATDNDYSNFEGKVIDKTTGRPIPYCSIVINETHIGTSTNEEGDFIIELKELPTELIFSHVSYEEQKYEVSVSTSGEIIIELTPLIYELEAVVLQKFKNDFAVKLAKSSFERMLEISGKVKYGNAFYRQKSKNDNDYSELVEIIFDAKYDSNGIREWEILEGRYAVKKDKINNKNYTLLSRLMKSIQPDTQDLIFLLSGNLEDFYNVSVDQVITSKERDIAILNFKPKKIKGFKTPIFDGQVYVNMSNKNVVKIIGNIASDDLSLIKLSEEADKENYQLMYEMTFKEDDVLGLVVDYIKIDHEFDYYENKKLKTKIWSTSTLSFFNHYSPTSRRRLGGRYGDSKSDWQKLDVIGYNEKFWKNNPIVKRTPIEEEVISAFEKDNAFESIYINNNNQIASSGSNISNEIFIKEIDSFIKDYNNKEITEKIYLHTNRNVVLKGEDLFYSIYNSTIPNNQHIEKSKLVYVNLVSSNNEVVISKRHYLDYGRGAGSIKIGKDIPLGTYQLIAYTNWMRNYEDDYFFIKKIDVIGESIADTNINSITGSKIDLQFFPEGGNLIADLNNKIAFKAIGEDGINKEIKGRIIDSQQKTITFISTIDRGSGFFNLKPKKDESYYAILENGSKYRLPNIESVGYSMTVNNLRANNISVRLEASKSLRNKDFYIIGQLNNKKYYQGKFNFLNKSKLDIEIPRNKLPSGVMTLTVFDDNSKPCAERALFINNEQELIITTKLNTELLNKRQEITLDISVRDLRGLPVSTDLSLAVNDAELLNKTLDESNLLTYLLLESDLKGYIENPGSFFKDRKRATKSKLDLVMLTNGWRRIHWKKAEDDKGVKAFNFEKGYSVSGVVKNLYNNVLPNIKLKMIAQSDDAIRFYETKTSSDGSFLIENIELLNTVNTIYKGYNSRDLPIDIKVDLDDNNESNLNISATKGYNKKFVTNESNGIGSVVTQNKRKSLSSSIKKNNDIKKENERLRSYSKSFLKDGIELDEVLVEAKVKKEKVNPLKSTSSTYGVKPSATLYVDDYITTSNFVSLLSRIPGVNVSGSSPLNTTVTIRQKGNPLWILDGVALPRPDRNASGFTRPPPVPIPTSIASLSGTDVERIEVLKGSAASIFGSRGSDGVILVYTKRIYSNRGKDIKSAKHEIVGYSISKEFYSPNYNIKKPEHIKIDHRAAIYWNPSISTNHKGKASVTFFNSDIAKKIQVSIEGVSINGAPGVYLETYGKD